MTPTEVGPEVDAEEATSDVARALGAAGLEVHELDDIHDLGILSDVIDAIWRRDTPMLEQGLLRAFAEAGGYVVGAFAGETMIGGAVAFRGSADGQTHLHSHVAGFVDAEAGGGRGRALKLHQRAWCLERGIETIQWTFDPLVRRNAWFNLQRLGVTPARYEVNYYGGIRDDRINGSDESDRFFARWDLRSDVVRGLAAGDRGEPDEAALRTAGAVDLVDEHGQPTGDEPEIALVQIPEDIVAIRHAEPEAAVQWRRSTRDALAPRLARGHRVTGMTKSGRYVVTP